MKTIKWFILIITFTLSFSQSEITFNKFGEFRWDISLDHIIVYLNSDYNEFQLNTKLSEVNGKVVRKLNNNNFYLVQFRNHSKTEIIFEKQIKKIRNISFIRTIIPVMKFTEKLSNVDIYENSEISGFSHFKNDSLFQVNLNLKQLFVACYDKEFRNQPKFVKYVYVNFRVVEGKTENLSVLETDMELEYLECVKRVIINQDWKNQKFKGEVSFFYIVYLDKK